jgi:hypothetical protein
MTTLKLFEIADKGLSVPIAELLAERTGNEDVALLLDAVKSVSPGRAAAGLIALGK